MRNQTNSRKTVLLMCSALALTGLTLIPGYAQKSQTAGYTVTVSNNSSMVILALLTSENGKRWGKFDIGDGLAPSRSVKLEWMSLQTTAPAIGGLRLSTIMALYLHPRSLISARRTWS